MNERERAEALARAIDELIRGAQTPDPDFGDEELRSLLRVAGARLQQSSQAQLKAADHETEVWRRLVARLESHGEPEDPDPEQLVPDPEVRGVISARRQVAEEVHALAEKHRDDVWRRVQERIAANKPKEKKGIFGFLKARTEGDNPAGSPPTSRTRLVPTGDSDLDSLLRVALSSHTALRQAGEHALSAPQSALRSRLRGDPARQRPIIIEPPARPNMWLRAGAMAVVLAIAAILGPMPVTGFSGSPAAEAARYVGRQIGVTEVTNAPPAPGDGTSVQAQNMTAADAGAQLSLALAAPATLLGFNLESQRFYSTGITSSGQGTFAAAYANADDTAFVSLYEEAAGGTDFSVATDSAMDVAVGDVTGTYYEGGWVTTEHGALNWQATGIQTLIFERNGVRFVVQYMGPQIAPADFTAAAAAIS